MRALVILFTPVFATMEQVQEALDKIPEITYWYRLFPFSIFVTTSLTVGELAQKLEAVFGTARRFVVIEIDPAKAQGRMTEQGWHLMAHPEDPRVSEKK